jgi:hypothetical protein
MSNDESSNNLNKPAVVESSLNLIEVPPKKTVDVTSEVKCAAKSQMKTCQTKKSKLRANSFELDLFAEQFKQMEIELTETYNLSVAEILEGASSSATGEFEIEMREYFEVKAENALSIMGEVEYPNLNLLRQYLLFGAKIAIIEFLMRPEIQANVREFYQKRLHVERYLGCQLPD